MIDPTVFEDAYILTGPTASGKSAVGLVLAEQLNAEILCMDSMTLYRGMDIGTAKPTQADQHRVPHHLIDLRDPWESASVAWWLQQAAHTGESIKGRGKALLFVGGTPLYLKALLCGLFAAPKVDPKLRQELEALPNEVLHERLLQVDVSAANRIHVNDQKRLVRALEVYQSTCRPITGWQQQFDKLRPRNHRPMWLDWPRDALYRRIEARIDQMLADGWVEEVRRLQSFPQPLGKEAAQAAGYRELADYLASRCMYEEAVANTKTRTRQLAKRQLTWLRNLPGLQAIPVRGEETPDEVAKRCFEALHAPT